MAPEGTTLYLRDDLGSGLLVEKFTGTSISQWNEYLVAGGQVVGVRFERSDSTAPVDIGDRPRLSCLAPRARVN